MARPTKAKLVETLLETTSLTKEQLEALSYAKLQALSNDAESSGEAEDDKKVDKPEEEAKPVTASPAESEKATQKKGVVMTMNVNHNNTEYRVGEMLKDETVVRLFVSKGYANYI